MRSAILLLSFLFLLTAQQPDEVRIRSGPYQRPSAATIAVDANLVELAVIVRDRKGAPAGGFQESDFAVLDDSKKEKITLFSELRSSAQPSSAQRAGQPGISTVPPPDDLPSVEPRYIALFFDDTHQGVAGFDRSRRAAEKLIADGLRPGGHIGIFTGSGAVMLDFTTDARLLLSTLAAMRRHPESNSRNGFGACPTLTPYQAYVIASRLDPLAQAVAAADIKACAPETPPEIALQQAQTAAENAWDALKFQSSNVVDVLALTVKRLAAAPGKRVLLMVSPGFVTGGLERQLGSLADSCLRAHIVVNALDDEGLIGNGAESPESLGAYSGPRVAWAAKTLMLRTQIVTGFLADLAASSGGEFIYNNNDLAGGLRTLAAVPEVSYLVGFSPPSPPDGKYHKLKVTVAKPGGYQVSARPGYFSIAQPPKPETAQQRIDRVAASGESLAQFPAVTKARAVADKKAGYRIQVDITLDATRLAFASRDGKSIQQLTFVTVLQDQAGNFLEGRQAVMDMALTPAARADLEAKGIKATTSFTASKGSYRIREVIREAVQNHIATSDSSIDIR